MENQLKSELRRTALLQERLAKRAEKLLDDMDALAAKLEGKDPGLHEMLDRSVKIAKPPANPKEVLHADLPDAMRGAALQLKDEFDLPPTIDPKTRKQKPARLPNVPGARTSMLDIVDILEKMLAALDQNRADELEKLTVNLKKTEKNLDDLGKRIDELKDKIAAAAKIGDPQQREKTLKKLTDELRALQKEAEQKAGDLARLHAQDAAKDLKDAAKKLERGVEELERGDDAKDVLDEARAKIADAQDKLKDANAAAEEELSREKIAKIVDRLKGLKERQDAAAVESERLLKSVLQNKKWLRPVFVSLIDLEDRQKELGRDTTLVQEKLKGAKVYHAILERTLKDMNAATALIDDHRIKSIKRHEPNVCDDKELLDEKNLAEATIRLQQAASNRLQRLIDALLPELEPPPEPEPKQPGGGKEGAGKDQDKDKKGGIQAQDGIPGVAQLKALKAEQLEVNERTKEFAERHPDFNRLSREEQAELDGIRAEQERLARSIPRNDHFRQGGGRQQAMKYAKFLSLVLLTTLATVLVAQDKPPAGDKGDKKDGDDKGKESLAARVAKNMKAAEERLKSIDPGDVTQDPATSLTTWTR